MRRRAAALPPNNAPAPRTLAATHRRCLATHPDAPHEDQLLPGLAHNDLPGYMPSRYAFHRSRTSHPQAISPVIQRPDSSGEGSLFASHSNVANAPTNSHFGNILFSLHYGTFVVTSVRDKVLAPQQAHMPSGRITHAAGRTLPGITPSSEPKFLIALSRLEILATPTKQTTAPFLIDANHAFFETQKSPRPIVIRVNNADPHGSRGVRRRGRTRRTTAGHPSRPHQPVASSITKSCAVSYGLRSLGRATGRTIALPPSLPHLPASLAQHKPLNAASKTSIHPGEAHFSRPPWRGSLFSFGFDSPTPSNTKFP